MRRSFAISTWLGATAVATSIAWLAVSSVITSVTASASGPSIARASSVAAGQAGAQRHAPLTSTTIAPKPPATSADSTATTSVTVTRPRVVPKPAPVRVVTPTTQAATSVPNSAPTTAAPPPPQTTTTTPPSQTFSGAGGVVTASCSGSAIQFVSASPNNGYSMRVDSTGPADVRVEFSSDRHDTEIYATCQSGKPVANVYEDS